MKALVTGHTGLVGKRLTIFLQAAGYEVTGVSDAGRNNAFVDARDFFRYNTAEYFDLVVHCAAVVGGRKAVESPLRHARNLEIDASLFQWAERARPGKLVYVSSVSVYPAKLQRAHGRLLEEPDINLADPCIPDQLYGWAKLTGELMAARLAASTGVHVSVVRPFTIYGREQATVHPFASFLAQMRRRANPIQVWGSGEQVRDFIYVDDVAKGIIAVADMAPESTVNLCTGRGTSLNELAVMVAAAAGYHPKVENMPGLPEGMPYLVGSTELMSQYYKPQASLEQNVRRIVVDVDEI